MFLKAPIWILTSLLEMVDVLQAEENTRTAVLLRLFTAKADTKKAAADLKRSQSAFLRRQRRIRDRLLYKQKKPQIDVINPAELDEEQRARLRAWAAEEGIETQS